MRARFIPFALIGVLVLAVAGCDSGSGGDPTRLPVTTPVSTPGTGTSSMSESGPPHPPSPTVPADVPTTGPNLVRTGERPPVMPLEATQHTQPGAIAFAKFFIQTIDWAYATTSTSYMRHYFAPGCVTCKSIQAGIDQAHAKGRHFIGDRITITSVTHVESTREHGAEYRMVVAFDVTSVEVVDSHGRFVDGDRALKLQNQVSVRWAGNSWVVVYMLGTP